MRPLSPVFWKELVQVANRRRTFALRTGYLLALFALLSLYWLSEGDFAAARSMSVSMAARFGRTVFLVIVWTELAAAALFTPAFTANLLTGERSANTLGLLFLTRLGNANIVQDKGLSRVVYMLQYMLLSLPFLFVCLMFGGITTGQILVSQVTVFSVVLISLSASLFFSTVLPNYFSALSASYIVIFFYLVAVPMVLSAFLAFFMRRGSPPVVLLGWLSPLFTMAAVSEPGIASSLGGSLGWLWVGPLATGGAAYVLSVAVSSLLLPRAAARSQAKPARRRGIAGLSQDSAWRVLWRTPFLPFLFLAELLERRPLPGRNPVLWRESGVTGRPGRLHMVYLTGALGYLYVGLAVLVGLSSAGFDGRALSEFTKGYGILCLFFAFLFLSTSAASSIATEREENTLDILASTSLSSPGLVLGKFFGVLRSSLLYAVLPVALALLGMVLGPRFRFLPFLFLLATLAFYAAWLAALGVLVSALSRTAARAVTLTVCLLVLLNIALSLSAAVLADLAGSRASDFLLSFSPGYWTGAFLLDPAGRDALGGAGAMAAVMAVYSGATVLFLFLAVHAFRKTSRPGG